jgi:ketosteroid isomerase-like protein
LAVNCTGVGGVYHGHDGVRKWLADVDDVWGDEIRGEVEAYFDLGERTLVFCVTHARGQHSGVEFATPFATVNRWRDGRVVYAREYARREDALRDLGVSENELEPIAP